jgi:hypothetical protein
VPGGPNYSVASRRGQSIILAEVGGWTGKVTVVTRIVLPAFLSGPEAHNVAAYLLSGAGPNDPFRSRVYVGESATIGRRLREHDADEQRTFRPRHSIRQQGLEPHAVACPAFLRSQPAARRAARPGYHPMMSVSLRQRIKRRTGLPPHVPLGLAVFQPCGPLPQTVPQGRLSVTGALNHYRWLSLPRTDGQILDQPCQ